METTSLEAYVRRSPRGYRAVVPALHLSAAAPSWWAVKAAASTKARAVLGLTADSPDPLMWREERRTEDRVDQAHQTG